MGGCSPSTIALWLVALVALSGTAAAQPETPMSVAPYEARYSIYRNGKLTGKVDVELQRRNDRWTLRSSGSGTHGLARLLGARDNEEVRGRVHDGRFLPERYRRRTLVSGLDDDWTVGFDWEKRQVSITHNDESPLVLDMVGESLDPLSLKLEMRRRLAEERFDLRFQMVEEDEIDEQNFRVLPTERLETSLGCLLTLPVEKIRHQSRRYTRAWHAPQLGHIEVRMEHGVTGGNHIEMRITELAVDGRKVAPRPGCAALQQEPGGP